LRFHPTIDTCIIPMMDPHGKIHGLQIIRGFQSLLYWI